MVRASHDSVGRQRAWLLVPILYAGASLTAHLAHPRRPIRQTTSSTPRDEWPSSRVEFLEAESESEAEVLFALCTRPRR